LTIGIKQSLWIAPTELGLDLKGIDAALLNPLKSLLDPGMYIEKIGSQKQNASIKMKVEAIASFDDYEAQRDKVEVALAFAHRIVRLWSEHRDLFEGVLLSPNKATGNAT
jgi:hypothetical protein